MIDYKLEKLVPLVDVPSILPEAMRGTDVGTIRSWSKRGCRGVILETIAVGKSIFTLREAVDRFISATTAARHRATASV